MQVPLAWSREELKPFIDILGNSTIGQDYFHEIQRTKLDHALLVDYWGEGYDSRGPLRPSL